MQLIEDNYYSKEADKEYMSVSQFKEFMGTFGRPACEAKAVAKLNGEWEDEPSQSLLVGSYVDSWFDATLDKFKDEHPEIFTKTGGLRAEYRKAEEMIARCQEDPLFMGYMSGQKQVIMTGEIFGVKWKCKMDSYIEDHAIVDLKTVKSVTELKWVKDTGYMDFVRYWGYDIQGAVYQEIVRQNTGKKLPFFIAAVTKEEYPNIEIIHVDDVYLREAMGVVKNGIRHVMDVKNGKIKPHRCGICNYCHKTKILSGPIEIGDLVDGMS